jgi:hypothetical protein
MIKALLAAGVIVTFAGTAMAEEYYVVHGSDRHCRVVERRSEGQDFIRIGPLSFGTRDEAERHVKVVCRDNGYYRGEEHRQERREERRDDRRNEERRENR